MAKNRIVFSTNPDWQPEGEAEEDSLPNTQQSLRIHLEKKGRRGKSVSIVRGFKGSQDDLKALAKELKSKCGTGGSAKDGEIIIQGDKRDQILSYLKDQGYSDVKKSGG